MLHAIVDLLKIMSTAHGAAKASVAETFKPDGVHTTDYLENQRQTKRIQIKVDYLGKMLAIHDRLRVEGDAILKRIGSIKYPLSTNPLESSRTAGELQSMSAMLTIQTPLTSARKLDLIANALSIGRTDYAWTLIDAERGRISSISDSVAPNPNDKALLKGMSEIVARFDIKGELAGLEQERELIPEIREHAEAFERYIGNEHLTGSFVTVSEIRTMSEDDTRANIDSVNFVMSDAV
jgi:hypothetical protein